MGAKSSREAAPTGAPPNTVVRPLEAGDFHKGERLIL
jgi:hypothetical protein